jgi:hypothetical protein
MAHLPPIDVAGLILALISMASHAATAIVVARRGRADTAGSHRAERWALTTGGLAAATVVVALITEDLLRVVLFAFIALGAVATSILLRRHRLDDVRR